MSERQRSNSVGGELAERDVLFGLIEAAPDAIVVVDDAGRIAFVNRLTSDKFGYSREELIGQPVELLVPERFRAQHVGYRRAYGVEPQARPMGTGLPLWGRRKAGSEFPVEISISPIDTAARRFYIGIVRDATERHLAEAKLRASLREKDVLLKEVHHRVKNNLQIVMSLLDLQAGHIADAKALELLRESQSRLRSIALFHERLYQAKDLSRIDIAEYLRGVANALLMTPGANPDLITLDIDAEPLAMAVDAAIACGLLVNELVSNSLKHAFPGRSPGTIRLTLRRSGDQGTLTVADDGVGLDAGIDIRDPTTLGLKLVSILVEQLRGTLALDTSRGTSVVVRFPWGEDR